MTGDREVRGGGASRALVFTGGGLVMLSSIPHALLGWPPQGAALRAANVAPEIVAGLAVGWHFGSAAMAALGALVLISARRLGATAWAWQVPFVAGAAYLVFGISAFVYRAFLPHFLGFVAIGAALVAGAIGARRGGAPGP